MSRKNISIFLMLALLTVLSLSAVSATDDNQTLSIADEQMLATEYTVDGTTTSDIQNAIDTASDGDTINLGKDKAYNINADSITVNKNVTIKGENVNITAESASGAIKIRSSGCSIQGITFLNPNPLPEYGGTIRGVAITASASNNIIIDNCRFINYASGVYFSTTRDSKIMDSYFTGTTTSVKTAESGTKAVNLMSSNNIEIINNTFYGPVLDGLSIASGSGNIHAENNTFINNTYAIFYGGASTEGSKIRNNRFITCGMINTSYYSSNLKQYIYVNYQDLPVISLQKASDNIEIVDNTFTVKNDNILIISEAENTAHGYPSSIGSINITGNKVLKADSTVNPKTVTFYYLNILSSLAIKPTGDIVVKGNDFSDVNGINEFELIFSAIESSNGDILIPKAYTETYLTVNYVKDGRVIIALNDINGEEISFEKITYSLNGGADVTDTTDEYGHIYINNLEGDVKITAKYTGSDKYYGNSLTATVSFAKQSTTTPASTPTVKVTKKATTLKIAKKTFKKKATKKLTATLKSSGKAIKNKKITFKVNGKTYSAKTNAKGVATVKIKLTKKGTFKYTAKFAGDAAYKAVSKTNKIKVK